MLPQLLGKCFLLLRLSHKSYFVKIILKQITIVFTRDYMYIYSGTVLSIKTLAICLLTCKALDKAAFMNRPGVKRLRKYISY